MSDLETALRVVGFVTAALGTCAAVPAASWRAWADVRRWVIKAARWALHRRVGATIVGLTAVGTSLTTGWATLSTSPATGGTLEERVARIEQRLEAVDKQQQKAAADLQQEVRDRTAADDELREHVDAQVMRIDQTLEEQQQAAEEVDARALPVVLFGALLSSFPDLLGASPFVATLAICVGIGLFFRAWVLLDAAPHAQG